MEAASLENGCAIGSPALGFVLFSRQPPGPKAGSFLDEQARMAALSLEPGDQCEQHPRACRGWAVQCEGLVEGGRQMRARPAVQKGSGVPGMGQLWLGRSLGRPAQGPSWSSAAQRDRKPGDGS